MLFREIHVRNFRKLVLPLVIGDIGDGLTVIAGDNEEGKSTVLDAMRAGLFERHNLGGEGLAKMQPFGSRVRPEIQLCFEIKGRAYRLDKAFGQRPSARFETPNCIFEGPAAEEKLAELLTFRVARREAKPDDQGILGLFWLEQGRSLEALGFGEIGRSTLRASFEKEVGDVLGGNHGRQLMVAAKTKRDALLTATGRPKAGGDLAEAIAEVVDATRRVQQLEIDCREYDRDIAELERVKVELAQIDAETRIEKAQQALAEAEGEVKKIEELRNKDDAATVAVKLAEAEFRNANDRCAARQMLVEALHKRSEELAIDQGTLIRIEAQTEEFSRQFSEAKAAFDNATAANSMAEVRLALSEARRRKEALEGEIGELDRRISEVDGLVAVKAAAVRGLSETRIDAPTLERMQRHDSAVREARAALSAAATWLRFLPSHGQATTKDGTELSPGELVEVTELTRFALEGFGAVEVEPGGSVLAESRERLTEAEAALSGALIDARVADVGEAVTELAARKKAESDIVGADQLIAVHAPQGIEALRSYRLRKSEVRASIDLELDNVSAPFDLGDSETERHALDAAKLGETTARTALNDAQGRQQQHGSDLAIVRDKFQNAQRYSAEAKQALDIARAEISDTDLSETLRAAAEAQVTAKRAKTETAQNLAQAKPTEAERRRGQAQTDLATIKGKERSLREQEIGIENRLVGADKKRIREELDEARGQMDRAASRQDRIQAEVNALKLLVETLDSAERNAKEAFLEPVLHRVQPFLDLVFPGMGMTLDEDTLEITEIARHGRTEPYRALSIGTREQLSILVRTRRRGLSTRKGISGCRYPGRCPGLCRRRSL